MSSDTPLWDVSKEATMFKGTAKEHPSNTDRSTIRDALHNEYCSLSSQQQNQLKSRLLADNPTRNFWGLGSNSKTESLWKESVNGSDQTVLLRSPSDLYISTVCPEKTDK
jgi:hypothetical protein